MAVVQVCCVLNAVETEEDCGKGKVQNEHFETPQLLGVDLTHKTVPNEQRQQATHAGFQAGQLQHSSRKSDNFHSKGLERRDRIKEAKVCTDPESNRVGKGGGGSFAVHVVVLEWYK